MNVKESLLERKTWLLFLFAIVFIALYFVFKKVDWVAALFSNLGAGFLGAFLTVWFIDNSLERQRKQESVKLQTIVLTRLKPVLLKHLILLCAWYKAATSEKPSTLPNSAEDLFSDDYYERIRALDFSMAGPTWEGSNWFHYSAKEMELFRNRIWQVVGSYAHFLDSNWLGMLESLADSELVNSIIEMGSVDLPALDRQGGVPRTYNVLFSRINIVRDHIDNVNRLLDYYRKADPLNPIVIGHLALWHDNRFPLWGSARQY